MDDYEETAWTPLNQLPAPPRRGRRWLVIGGLAIAFMLALVGVGAFMASSNSTAQASTLTSSSSQTLAAQSSNNSAQGQVVAQGGDTNARAFAAGPGAQGQCEMLTVSSVKGNTIVAKTASGSSVTIHTTASTRYTQAGKAAAASAIKAGTRINVMGTHNSDGSITATSIDIG